jgi:hypothetical protein
MKAFLEVPTEIMQVVFRIDSSDPLEPLLEAVRNLEVQDFSSQSMLRLKALASSGADFGTHQEFSTVVLRDLWKGQYWSIGEIRKSEIPSDGSIHQIQPMEAPDDAETKSRVKDVVAPFLGWLSKETGIEKDLLVSRVRLEEISKNNDSSSLFCELVQKTDRSGRTYWVQQSGPFKKMVSQFIEEIDGFQMVIPETEESLGEWKYPPELKALVRARERNMTQRKLTRIIDQFENDFSSTDNRLESIQPVVGFRQDMWDAAQGILNRAKKHAFILTSFHNETYLQDYSNVMNDLDLDLNFNLILSLGEPSRGQEQNRVKVSDDFIARLNKLVQFNIHGGVSPRPSHAKILITDQCELMITSCNLFSGQLDAGVLESGLVIKDLECAKELINIAEEDGWVQDNMKHIFEDLKSSIHAKTPLKTDATSNIQKKLKEIRADLGDEQKTTYALLKFNQLLMDIAERPTWKFVRTREHRPFLLDSVERFNKRLVLASDGLRSNGLDLATIESIHQQARKEKATVHVWWGRHPPYSKPLDEVDERGRKDAARQLNELRNRGNGGKEWYLIPKHVDEPMETHAKLFIVDDARLMMTSDNTLSFGDTKEERGDATELGILVDHPRLARQIHGSMDLWLPDFARIPNDLSKWWSLFGEELNHLVSHPYQRVPLLNVLDAVILRIESSDHLSKIWERELESGKSEIEIINRLALGVRFGVYCIMKKKNSKGVKSKLDENQIPEALVSQGFRDLWTEDAVLHKEVEAYFKEITHEVLKQRVDEVLLECLSEYNSSTGRREHFIVQDKRTYSIKAPNILQLNFRRSFVYEYLEKHKESILESMKEEFPVDLDIQWSKPHQPTEHALYPLNDREITPEIWAEAFVFYMQDPNVFEFVSEVYNRMTKHQKDFKLGSGKLGKYIMNKCKDYLDVVRKDKPTGNSLYVRKRGD